jgi:hypothetical protein
MHAMQVCSDYQYHLGRLRSVLKLSTSLATAEYVLLICRVSIEYQRKQAKAMQKYFRERSMQVQAEKSQCAFHLRLCCADDVPCVAVPDGETFVQRSWSCSMLAFWMGSYSLSGS